MPEVRKLTLSEMRACSDVVLNHVMRANGIDDAQALVRNVLATLYEQRYGPAEGSTAYRATSKQAAIRYFDVEADKLRWLTFTNLTKNDVRATRVDSLDFGWKITPRPWQELIGP